LLRRVDAYAHAETRNDFVSFIDLLLEEYRSGQPGLILYVILVSFCQVVQRRDVLQYLIDI